MSGIFRFCAPVLVLASLACASVETSVPVELPPRLDLAEWRSIGIVTFDGAIDEKLASQATRHFVSMLESAQPAVRIVELGEASALLEELGHQELDFEAVRAMGERYRVSVVFTGRLELDEAESSLEFREAPTSVGARVDVSGELAARLTETASGALLWSRSASGLSNVANVGLQNGVPSFGARTPADAEQGLVEHLVSELRHDFYPTRR